MRLLRPSVVAALLVATVRASLPFGKIVSGTNKLHCADDDGNFKGLVADEAFDHRCRQPMYTYAGGPDDECWQMIDETMVTPNSGYTDDELHRVVKNSFTGTYAQVLPDDGDDYNVVTSTSSLEILAKLSFRILPDRDGVHVLSVRWAGGDNIGAGDSFYVMMHDVEKGEVVPGVSTWKPKVVPITEAPGVDGCCYNIHTHVCACLSLSEVTDEHQCDHSYAIGDSSDSVWVISAEAANYGIECESREGEMTAVKDPLWYEFAGRPELKEKLVNDKGEVVYGYAPGLDFNVQPWDSTCEAEGTGTADTGIDMAQYDLVKGKEYTLEFYPREDGVALDAWHLSGPDASPPDATLVLKYGDSTLCPEGGINVAALVTSLIVLALLAGFGYWKRADVAERCLEIRDRLPPPPSFTLGRPTTQAMEAGSRGTATYVGVNADMGAKGTTRVGLV